MIMKILSSVAKMHTAKFISSSFRGNILTDKELSTIKMCHYDLKQENILMMNQFTPVLGDFGMAVPTDLVDESRFFGTPKYLGPQFMEK